MSAAGPYRDGYVHVLSAKCSTCIFRPGNLMHLTPGRRDQMVADSIRDDSAITCHQTLPYGGYDASPAVCRGFLDVHGHQVMSLRIAAAFGVLAEDEPLADAHHVNDGQDN